MTEQVQEDWFNINPTEDELQHMNDALLEYFAQNPIASKKPDKLNDIINGIIDVLEHTQTAWKEATRADLNTSKKRYCSLYDMVRRAYANVAGTKKKIEQWKQEQEAAIKKAKDSITDMSFDGKHSQDSDGREVKEDGDKSRASPIKTDVPAKGKADAKGLNKRQMDQLTEAVMSNLHDMVDNAHRRELKILKDKYSNEKRFRRTMSKKIMYMQTELHSLMIDLDAMERDDSTSSVKPKTPPHLSNKDATGLLDE